jgi:hypothetical protein
MSEYEVEFECTCEAAVDVRAAINTVGSAPRVYSTVDLQSHNGRARLSVDNAEEAMRTLRMAIEAAAIDAGTTCDLRLGDARQVGGPR